MNLKSDITEVKGIGPKTASLFYKLGIHSIEELLEYYPQSYDRFEKPVMIQETNLLDFAAVQGVVAFTPSVKQMRNLSITTVKLRDQSGDLLRVNWFRMPFLRGKLKPGMQIIVRGRLQGYGGARTMEHPELYTLGGYEKMLGTMQPVYSLTAGLSNKTIVKAVEQAVTMVKTGQLTVEETLSEQLRKRCQLTDKKTACIQIHFPEQEEELKAARRRLVFEEFYEFICRVRQMKQEIEQEKNHFAIIERPEVEAFLHLLPYRLTAAQRRTWQEISVDLTGEHCMNRLVQGDVGSGKTIVAFLAMYQTALCHYQAVMMAPTEVLATQHYQSVQTFIEQYGLPIRAVLLTGSMTPAQKRDCYRQIAEHEADIIIGTHALIQDKVLYDDLALVITDEQHRFGVKQRDALSEKGRMPHVLVMSATPIPRTLAIIIYGDLDISVIDELPASRLPIKNCVVDISYRPTAYRFIQKQVEMGHQAYVICPMIEESEQMDCENVIEYSERLRRELKGITITALHGRMPGDDKERIMKAFADGSIQVLVSTTVIEVGIDVPNSTVILIENAQQFGLAQLHQLRGRVGRGSAQSYCILINTSGSKESRKRLDILNHSNDGFFIASEDLKLRGPGDFFGIRQSGMLEFKLADIYTDVELLKLALSVCDENMKK